MTVMQEKAPAKINLYLHVLGKRPDGYHLLDSLVVFADVADELEASPAGELTLAVTGPQAFGLEPEGNSVLNAAKRLRLKAGITQGAALTLRKHLPVAAGIGGGSADAAAALRLLARLWNVKLNADVMSEIALSCGADVPACLVSRTLYMSGIGEQIAKGPSLAGMHLLLVNPRKPVNTAAVFKTFAGTFSAAPPHPSSFDSLDETVGFLRSTCNDLEEAAVAILPEISEMLALLAKQKGCSLARMSGSGATCFGIFASPEASAQAALALQAARPGWWVKTARVRP